MKMAVSFLLLLVIGSATSTARNGPLPEPPLPASVMPIEKLNDCTISDQMTRDACERAIRAKYEYDIESLHHRSDSFRWSLSASKIIFAVVVVLVLSGLVFAGIQFRVALARLPKERANVGKSEEQGQTGNVSEMATNFEVSATGIRVNSSVLGVIILTISMAFFYLYARYVYPIHELPRDNPDIVQGPVK